MCAAVNRGCEPAHILPPKSNPCDGVKLFEDYGSRERYLSTEKVQRLFDELGTNRNVQVGQMIRLLLYTGARKREILDARWDEIDFNRRLLTVPAARSKSKKPRHIPLSDAAIELLLSVPRQDDIPWVFFNPKTKKPPVSFFYAWDTIRQKIGLKDLRLHDLRHSYASFLVNAGRSLYEVQKLLGHHDPKMTMRYAHLSPQAMLEAVNVVGNVVGRTPVTAANQPQAAVASV
jgi:integrase